MKKIILEKAEPSIRKTGKQVRVSMLVYEELERLSEETGMSKSLIADKLLRQALTAVEVVDVMQE